MSFYVCINCNNLACRTPITELSRRASFVSAHPMLSLRILAVVGLYLAVAVRSSGTSLASPAVLTLSISTRLSARTVPTAPALRPAVPTARVATAAAPTLALCAALITCTAAPLAPPATCRRVPATAPPAPALALVLVLALAPSLAAPAPVLALAPSLARPRCVLPCSFPAPPADSRSRTLATSSPLLAATLTLPPTALLTVLPTALPARSVAPAALAAPAPAAPPLRTSTSVVPATPSACTRSALLAFKATWHQAY